jgi:hypothetical protein
MNAQTTADRDRVWNRRRPINYPKEIEVFGGIASPLLAGFSLTIVAQLVIGKDHPWLSQWATASFAIAAALFLYAVQFSGVALGFAATPSERLDFNPEAAFRPDVLQVVRKRQWEEMELRARYQSRARYSYNFGMLAFLVGLGLILVPEGGTHWPPGRLIGAAVVTIALVIEALWAVFERPKFLFPDHDDTQPDPLGDDGASMLFPNVDGAAG